MSFNFNNQQDFLDNIQSLANTHLSPKVIDIDKGYYPLAEMSVLGKAGLFAPHLNEYGNRLDLAILANAQVGRVCGTTGFLTWCHQVMGLYLDQSDNTALKQRILPDHIIANTFGGTALSNPMKTWANIESMRLVAKKDGQGYSTGAPYLGSATSHQINTAARWHRLKAQTMKCSFSYNLTKNARASGSYTHAQLSQAWKALALGASNYKTTRSAQMTSSPCLVRTSSSAFEVHSS